MCNISTFNMVIYFNFLLFNFGNFLQQIKGICVTENNPPLSWLPTIWGKKWIGTYPKTVKSVLKESYSFLVFLIWYLSSFYLSFFLYFLLSCSFLSLYLSHLECVVKQLFLRLGLPKQREQLAVSDIFIDGVIQGLYTCFLFA